MPLPPKKPGYFDKVNYIIDAWANPCEAPWYIYAEALGPAALEAFIVLISFGWADVARGFFRPRGLNPRRSQKRKGKWARRIPRFPEIGNTIGKYLPGAERAKGIKYTEFGKTLWRIDGQIQHGLFWWLVADVTLDFAFNFTSVLYQTEWCKASDKGRFSWQTGGLRIFPGFVWHNLTFSVKDYEFPFPNWIIDIGNAGAEGARITSAVNYKEFSSFGPIGGVQTRVIDADTGRIYFESLVVGTAITKQGVNVVNGQVPAGARFRVQGYHEGAWAEYTDGVVIGFEGGP